MIFLFQVFYNNHVPFLKKKLYYIKNIVLSRIYLGEDFLEKWRYHISFFLPHLYDCLYSPRGEKNN